MPTPYDDDPVKSQAGTSCPTCGQPIAPEKSTVSEADADYTICEFCGEDLPHHRCQEAIEAGE
jgi:RNA polymerase-binding transcription factor DksA